MNGIGHFRRLRSSIHGRVVFIIAGSLVVFLVLLNVIIRSVYAEFFNATLRQEGERISSLVEGALHYSMLEEDWGTLQITLDMIGTMPDTDGVSLYDNRGRLAFTSIPEEHNPDGISGCSQCHSDPASLFPSGERSYRIAETISGCGIRRNSGSRRHLIMRKTIMNERSCYTAACHAHTAQDEVLGSLLILLPLDSMDAFVTRSSVNLLLMAALTAVLLGTFLVIFIRRRIRDPLHSIVKASEAAAGGDTSIRLDMKPDLLEDIRNASQSFNTMLDNMEAALKESHNWSQQMEYKLQRKTDELSEAQDKIARLERLASRGRLSASVAHELNNPLSGILVYSKLIQKQLTNFEFRHPKKESILKNLKYIESETKRCGEIVKGFLDYDMSPVEELEEP